ncbi:CPCC family cysteine-rich protein [Actinosynnema sp. NPDC023794]
MFARLVRRRFACPCCGYLTLRERGGWDICPVCFWEDDGHGDHNADQRSGANRLTLTEARENFVRFGACDERSVKHVRPPKWKERR